MIVGNSGPDLRRLANHYEVAVRSLATLRGYSTLGDSQIGRITAQTAGMEAMKPLEAFGTRLPNAQANVLNRVGTKAKAQVIPALTRQTGLSKRIITKAVKFYRASPQNPRVMMITRGGEIWLRYFGAHEEGSGVVADVKGDRMV